METGIGIDKARNGWVLAEAKSDGDYSISYHSEIPEKAREGLIDIPLGLPENSRRTCDTNAMKILKPHRHYSIFYCPVRQAVYADSYEQACDINEQKTGNRLSKQSWNICSAIKEADRFIRNHDTALHECHPEISFKYLGTNQHYYSKKTGKGMAKRKLLVERILNISLSKNRNKYFEDCLDALILAAADLGNKKPVAEPEKDAEGVKMKLVRPELRCHGIRTWN
jgi:predicted RNase H-like nuclease